MTGEKLVFSCHSGDKDDKNEKEKDVIIITNNKEVVDPSKEDGPIIIDRDGPKEKENEINSVNPKSM